MCRSRSSGASFAKVAVAVASLFASSGCVVPPPAAEVPGSSEAEAAPAKDDVVVWEGRAPGEIYEAGEIREFEFRQGEQVIGHSWGRYAGSAEVDGETHHRFETRIELDLPGRPPVRSEGLLVLDAAGDLVEGYERSDAAELTFRRDGSRLVLSDGEREDEIGYEPQSQDVAVMAHSSLLHEELMLAMRTLKTPRVNWRLISLSGGAPVDWVAEVAKTGEGAVLESSLGERIEFSDGRIRSIAAPSSDLRIASVEDPKWPTWTIEGPRRLTYAPPPDATFSIRPVEIPGSDEEPELAGEVLVPEGKGPFAAVLWLPGSVSEDRHGFAGPPPVDLGSHEITDALAQAGFVVLRFDERGRGESEPGPLSFRGQVRDAKRALGMLLVQDEVDPDRVLLLGHGEGGLRALELARGRSDILGIALLATPGRPYREAFLRQGEAALQDVPPELRADAREQQRRMLDALERGESVPPELQAQATWIREVLQLDPDALVAGIDANLLLAQGEKDFELDPKSDLKALVRAAKTHRKKHEVLRYSGLDHLFKPQKGRSTPESYLEPRAVDTRFIQDLVSWAKRVSQSKKARTPDASP